MNAKTFFFVLICQQIAFVIRMNIQWFILFWCVNKTDERNEYTKLPCIVHLIYRHTDFICRLAPFKYCTRKFIYFWFSKHIYQIISRKKIFYFFSNCITGVIWRYTFQLDSIRNLICDYWLCILSIEVWAWACVHIMLFVICFILCKY